MHVVGVGWVGDWAYPALTPVSQRAHAISAAADVIFMIVLLSRI
jgi:hypothetical protein